MSIRQLSLEIARSKEWPTSRWAAGHIDAADGRL